MSHSLTAPRQQGRSLLELMIALAIGVIVLGAVLLTTSNSTFSGQVSDTRSRLNEDSQLAMNILVQQLRMAGYSSVVSNGTSPGNSQRFAGPGVRGCDNGFSAASLTAANWNAITDDVNGYSNRITCAAGAGTPSFAVLYEADAANTQVGAGGNPTDCLGQELTPVLSSMFRVDSSGDTVFVAENRYYLTPSATRPGVWTLNCQGVVTNADGEAVGPQPLVDNIEQMRVTYGVNVETAADATTNEVLPGNEAQIYMTATQINTAPEFAGDSLDRWRRVVSVRLCMVFRSERAEADEPVPYVDCAGNRRLPEDRFLRKVVTTTVALRNKTCTRSTAADDCI